MARIYEPEVEEAVVALLMALGSYPGLPLYTEEVIRKLPPEERLLLVIERLSCKYREHRRDARENNVGNSLKFPDPYFSKSATDEERAEMTRATKEAREAVEQGMREEYSEADFAEACLYQAKQMQAMGIDPRLVDQTSQAAREYSLKQDDCKGCGVGVDEKHLVDCPAWKAIREGKPYPDKGTTMTPEQMDLVQSQEPSPPITRVVNKPYDTTVYPTDREAHARIDTLQREVAYVLAQDSVSGLLVDKEGEQQRRFDNLLATFKRADQLALANLRKHGVAYT